MDSPYSNLPSRAFWRSAVQERDQFDPGDLFQPKFPINREAAIVTAGSCFAQHVGRALRGAGFNVVDVEPLKGRNIPDRTANAYGYRLYSARYGNIYTARQLWQLRLESLGRFEPAMPVWEKEGRYFDALRPNVEPEGLDSPELVHRHREQHLWRVRKAFGQADVFVFTFGLTEAWVHKASGTVYPTAPGTVAGRFDPDIFDFKNFAFPEVYKDFVAFRKNMMLRNPNLKFLVTVSPVPLTATASGHHVEVATSYSKSVLRAVCGTLVAEFDNVDYFPSYEIITSQNARGAYFLANKRGVTSEGVATAMRLFLAAHGHAIDPARPKGEAKEPYPERAVEETDDVVCEDVLLEAFAK